MAEEVGVQGDIKSYTMSWSQQALMLLIRETRRFRACPKAAASGRMSSTSGCFQVPKVLFSYSVGNICLNVTDRR